MPLDPALKGGARGARSGRITKTIQTKETRETGEPYLNIRRSGIKPDKLDKANKLKKQAKPFALSAVLNGEPAQEAFFFFLPA